MCGRTTSTHSRDYLARLLDVDEVSAPELPTSWNVAPTQLVYAVVGSSDGLRSLRALRWGLVPNWAKDPRVGARLINARAETITTRPAFRSLVNTHRALLPVSGFYEWRQSPRVKGKGQPFYFQEPDGEPVVFAGLWDQWSDAEGGPTGTCTIITTKANKIMAPVHHRMPVLLPRKHWDLWLHPGPFDPRLNEMLVSAADVLLEAHPVGTFVNYTTNDGPELVMPEPRDDDEVQKTLF